MLRGRTKPPLIPKCSGRQFTVSFDFLNSPAHVLIDLTHAHFWDISAVGVLDRVVSKLRARGVRVDVLGLNQASDTLIMAWSKNGVRGRSMGPTTPADRLNRQVPSELTNVRRSFLQGQQ